MFAELARSTYRLGQISPGRWFESRYVPIFFVFSFFSITLKYICHKEAYMVIKFSHSRNCVHLTMNVDKNLTELLDLVDQTMEQFDNIFRTVAPTKKRYICESGHDFEIDITKLNDKQCCAIDKLSRVLLSVKSVANKLRSRDASYQELAGAVAPWESAHLPVAEVCPQSPSETKVQTSVALLREYLIRELVRGEHLDSLLTARENAFVGCIAEKTEVTKRHHSNWKTKSLHVLNPNEHLNASSPHYTGCYIRKCFKKTFYFGVVRAWCEPYYHVVYEDADDEELTVNQVCQLLWTNLVPRQKAKACQFHANNSSYKIEPPAKKPCIAITVSDGTNNGDLV